LRDEINDANKENYKVILRIVSAALAAGALAQMVQMLFFWIGRVPVTGTLAASHWLVIAVFNLTAAALFGNRFKNRLWAAIIFVYPVVTALSLGAAFHFGTQGVIIFLVVIASSILVWTVLPMGQGAPLVASTAGAVLGATVSLYRARPGWMAASDFPLELVILVAVVTVGSVLLAGRLRMSIALPSTPVSLGVMVIAGSVAMITVGAGSGVGTVPSKRPDVAVYEEDDKPPIVLIVLDTLRADHLKRFGYHRDTMPNLERFADEHGTIAIQSFANGAHSLPSHASIFTGLYPPRHGAHNSLVDDPNPPRFAYPLEETDQTLAAVLTDNGYWSVGISANYGPLSPEFGLSQGFMHYEAAPSPRLEMRQRSPWALSPGSQERLQKMLSLLDEIPPFSLDEFFMGPNYRRSGEITSHAIRVLDEAEDTSLFLFLNYFDPHAPYYPPSAFRDTFIGRNSSLGVWGLKETTRRAVLTGGRDLSEQEYAHVTSLYDGELAYLDAELGRLLRRLEQHPRWEEMLVIITSDHGEAFGEHRYVDHGVSLYNELISVPVIIKAGKQSASSMPDAGSAESTIIQSVDIFPTVLQYAGIGIPPGIDGVAWGSGRSDSYAWLFVEQSYLQYGTERFSRELRTVASDDWKLIESSSGALELYNLVNDPIESHDLQSEFAAIRDAMTLKLQDRDEFRRRSMSGPDDVSPEAMERLRSLGYVE
jgi:arylsulfatase A-like enzyme